MNKSKTRFSRIVSAVNRNPGIRYSELVRICQVPKSTMLYYTEKMIKTGTVKVRKKQRECRFFPSSQINNHEKAILVALRKKGHRKILFFIKEKEGHFSEICRHIGLAPSTTSHKLDSLVRAGIVEFRYKNKIKIFKIKDPTITLRTIKQYQDWIKITER